MDPALSASLAAFGVCFALASVAPAPRRAPPRERTLYVGLLVAGMATYVGAFLLPFAGMPMAGLIGGIAATSMIMFCIWLARSPTRRESMQGSDQRGDGGDGGTKPPPSDPPSPRPAGDGRPSGPSLDWDSFDDERAGWEQPARERDLVGV